MKHYLFKKIYKYIITFIIIILLYFVYSKYEHKLFYEVIYDNICIENSIKLNDKCAIIGGGIGGISTLYYLQKSGYKNAILYEKSNMVSGNIKNYNNGCPMMMSCFDLPRSKYIYNLTKELGLKCTKCNCWNNITIKSFDRNLVISKREKLYEGLLQPLMFFKLVEAYSSINYFTNKSDFTINQLVCYLRNHSGSYYSIENGENYKLIKKLEYKVKGNIRLGIGVEKIKYTKDIFILEFNDKSFQLCDKIIISIPIHYVTNIIDKETSNNELLLIKNISECFYEQKAFSCFHTDINFCSDNSSLTYKEINYKGQNYYILTINPRVFYNNENVSKDKRITIWYENEEMVQINRYKILDKYKSSVSLLKRDKIEDFMYLSKQIKNNKSVYIASSYLSFAKWADDAIKMAYNFNNYKS